MPATVTADIAFSPGVTTLIAAYALLAASQAFPFGSVQITGAPGMPSVKWAAAPNAAVNGRASSMTEKQPFLFIA